MMAMMAEMAEMMAWIGEGCGIWSYLNHPWLAKY
jgi:hypothetical protein